MRIVPVLLAGFIAFILLVTANGAGYRYGVSDQAAYVPVVVRAENPAAFPRDADLLDTQGRFFVLDEILASIGRTTGASTETLFLGAYLMSIALVFGGVLSIGTRLYASPWLTIALAALLTLRHHIPRTSVNSLEPYFHPRVMSFGIGLMAVGAFLRHRTWLAVATVGVAAMCHVTTALWFAILLGTAVIVQDGRARRTIFAGGVLASAVFAWTVIAGPLRNPSTTMDAVWLEALGDRNFLFANDWPLWAWAANLGLLGVLWWAHVVRRRRGTATDRDAALVWGASALVAVFLITLPAVAGHVAVAVQFQVSRVFWIVDLLVAVYGIAALGERLTRRGMATFALVIVAATVGRGTYVIGSEHAERSLFQVSLPESQWLEAMRWIGSQRLDAYVLADPGHSYKYGASVRVASSHDVLLEDDKDSAIALYDRALAVQIVERRRALTNFGALSADEARALAGRYGLNLLVTEATLDLPELYRNARFRIYELRPTGPAS